MVTFVVMIIRIEVIIIIHMNVIIIVIVIKLQIFIMRFLSLLRLVFMPSSLYFLCVEYYLLNWSIVADDFIMEVFAFQCFLLLYCDLSLWFCC